MANILNRVYVPRPAPVASNSVAQVVLTVPKAGVKVETSVPGVVESQESGYAPFETLFHDFKLEAQPVYNFWKSDENTNETEEFQDKNREETPRYIRLVWDRAPDLKDVDAFAKSRLGRDAGVTNPGLIINGLVFNPTSLTSDEKSFDIAVSQLANGYLAAGVVETLVEVHTGSLVAPAYRQYHLVDEDVYLSRHNTFWGIPFSEFNNILWNRRSHVYTAQNQMYTSAPSRTSRVDRSYLVDGSYGFISPTRVGGIVAIRSSDGGIGFNARTCQVQRTRPNNRIDDYLTLLNPGLLDQNDDYWDYNRVRAKFIDTRLTGLVRPARVNSITQIHHAETMTAVAQNLDNLVAYGVSGLQHQHRDVNIPNFPSPTGVKTLEYVGYVIEKYAYEGSGFVLKETIHVSDRDQFEYYDSKVKYGVAYRYRIRAVVRWTRPRSVGVLGNDTTNVQGSGSSINAYAPDFSSFFGSEWSKNWATAILIDTQPPDPPDEFWVRPFSKEQYVLISFRVPYNPQRDINKMTLWRKLQDESGNDLTNWEQIQEYDAVARQGTRELYLTTYNHDPKDTTGTKFSAETSEVVENFVEYAPLNAQYIDRDVKYMQDSGYRYVYSALCHSNHGETSLLSDQLGVRLNRDWSRTGEFDVSFISCAGVQKDVDTGLFSTYPERRIRSELILKPDSVARTPASFYVTGQERTALSFLNENHYVMRIESLDNGQSYDIDVDLRYDNVPILSTTEDSNVLIADTDY